MFSEQTHKMKLEATHPSGAEEWACPECGRRFIAQWEPKFRRVILEQGQEEIIHVGQGSGFGEDESPRSAEDDLANDPKLQDVWKDLLEKLDFDSDDDQEDPKSP